MLELARRVATDVREQADAREVEIQLLAGGQPDRGDGPLLAAADELLGEGLLNSVYLAIGAYAAVQVFVIVLNVATQTEWAQRIRFLRARRVCESYALRTPACTKSGITCSRSRAIPSR